MQLANEQDTKRASDESKNVKRNHVAAKVWSEPLQAHVWVVADEEDIKVFTTHGLRGEIYTSDEILALNCMDSDSLKALHTILFDK
jgi:uncharacterized protein (UPF0548 family)